jgi:hypothetical protein
LHAVGEFRAVEGRCSGVQDARETDAGIGDLLLSWLSTRQRFPESDESSSIFAIAQLAVRLSHSGSKAEGVAARRERQHADNSLTYIITNAERPPASAPMLTPQANGDLHDFNASTAKL